MSTSMQKTKSLPARWLDFIKSLSSAAGDLSKLQAPSFILSDVSMLELTSYWVENTSLFLSLANGTSPESRQLLVTKWYLSSMINFYRNRNPERRFAKKQFNAFLGEEFIGEWAEGISHKSEQVSHHPPISAYHISAKNTSFEGYSSPETSFSGGSITVKQPGHAILTLNVPGSFEEQYLITFATIEVQGLILAHPDAEMVGDVIIQSSHGLLSKTEFKGKKLFSGKSKAHHFNTVITSTDSKPLYEIEGCWTGDSIYTFIDSSAENLENKAVGDLFCSFDAVPSTEITVNGSEGVKEWQSRNAWKDVAISIREGDFNGAQTAKVKLETAERLKRKEELASKVPFKPRLFAVVEDDEVYRRLAKMCDHRPETEICYKLIVDW